MLIRLLTLDDAALLQQTPDDVFDDPVVANRVVDVLQDPRHHVAAAIDGGRIIGFASAVHYLHPDKRQPELWINEVGVAAEFRRQGIARALLQRLQQLAFEQDCSDVWVLTDRGNTVAMQLDGSIPDAQCEDADLFTLPPRPQKFAPDLS